MLETRPPVIDLASPAKTEALARKIAPCLRSGDTLLLEGPIGAGKTHFARALIKARLAAEGKDEDVPSPTFTLVQSYEAGGVEIWHADLYRLSDPAEVAELGLDDAFERAICLVEWPDRLGGAAPAGAITLAFDTREGDHRVLMIKTGIARWKDITICARDEARAG